MRTKHFTLLLLSRHIYTNILAHKQCTRVHNWDKNRLTMKHIEINFITNITTANNNKKFQIFYKNLQKRKNIQSNYNLYAYMLSGTYQCFQLGFVICFHYYSKNTKIICREIATAFTWRYLSLQFHKQPFKVILQNKCSESYKFAWTFDRQRVTHRAQTAITYIQS